MFHYIHQISDFALKLKVFHTFWRQFIPHFLKHCFNLLFLKNINVWKKIKITTSGETVLFYFFSSICCYLLLLDNTSWSTIISIFIYILIVFMKIQHHKIFLHACIFGYLNYIIRNGSTKRHSVHTYVWSTIGRYNVCKRLYLLSVY